MRGILKGFRHIAGVSGEACSSVMYELRGECRVAQHATLGLISLLLCLFDRVPWPGDVCTLRPTHPLQEYSGESASGGQRPAALGQNRHRSCQGERTKALLTAAKPSHHLRSTDPVVRQPQDHTAGLAQRRRTRKEEVLHKVHGAAGQSKAGLRDAPRAGGAT